MICLKKLFNVIDHRVQLYLAPNGKIIKAKLPKDVRKAGLFSARMIAFTGYLKARCHTSYSTLQSFSDDIMDLNISQSYLAKICTKKLSPALQGAYGEVGQFIRNAPSRHLGRYQKATEKFKKAFLQKVSRPPDHSEALNIKSRFVDGIDKCYFLFLEKEGVNPTNNLSEQAIRFVVIDRRITQGTRSFAGMRWCERAWTVVATCARHKRSVYDFFVDAHTGAPYPRLIPAKL